MSLLAFVFLAAILAAGALAAPAQFSDAASRLEAMKPGLGERLIASVRAVPRLSRLAETLRLTREGLTYDRKGRLDAFYDAARTP